MMLRVTSDGELEGDWEKIVALAAAYDNGDRSVTAYQAKIYSLVFDRGYDYAMDEVDTHHEQTMFLITHTGGHA